jgi:hypothetical protein
VGAASRVPLRDQKQKCLEGYGAEREFFKTASGGEKQLPYTSDA